MMNSFYKGRFEKVDFSHQRYVPRARSGHAAVADDANLYVFGGFNNQTGVNNNTSAVFPELWVFNFAKGNWYHIKTPGVPIHAASATLKLWNRKLFLFGGTGYPFGKEMSNSMHVCHIDNNFKWEQLTANGEVSYYNISQEEHFPLKAYGQGVVSYNGEIYVFGGAIGLYRDPVNHLHRLKFTRDKAVWEKITTKGVRPLGRYKAELVLSVEMKSLLVLGGGCLYGSQDLDNLHSFSLETLTWGKVHTQPDVQQGIYPVGRVAFGCAKINNMVYISGGRHYNIEDSMALDDIWSLDLQSLTWNRQSVSLPTPLYFHTMSVNDNGEMFIFGGVYNDTRVDNLLRAQIHIPKLSELCWNNCVIRFKNRHAIKPRDLLKIGIPCNFVERLPTFEKYSKKLQIRKR